MKKRYKLRGWVKVLLIYLLFEGLAIGFLFYASSRFEILDNKVEVMMNE